MKQIRLADVAETCSARFRAGVRDVPVDQAKNIVRSWIADMQAELERKLDAEHAPTARRRQLTDALEVVRGAALGTLGSVMITRQQRNSGQSDRGQPDRGQSDRRQSDRGQHGYGLSERGQSEQVRRPPQGGLNVPIFGRIFGGEPEQPQRPSQRLPGETASIVTETLYQQLRSACEALDRLLAAAEPPEEIPVVPWAWNADFLADAQRLFTAYVRGDGKLALSELELLEERLRARYGVEIVVADDDTCNFFTVYPSEPGDGSYETKKPAIVVDGRLARRGEALGPVTAPGSRPSIWADNDRPTIPALRPSAEPDGSGGTERGEHSGSE